MSRQHRHREKGVKKMHSIIGDYEAVLDQIGTIPGVRSVITGTISPNKSETEEITFQYFTDSGIKLLAKTTEAVQELFLVCENKQTVLQELHARGHLRERVKKMKKDNKSSSKKPAAPANRPAPSNNRYNPKDLPKDAKPTTLKDLLSADVLSKLQEQSNELKEQERVVQENKRQAELERRAKEQKELDNNFEYLLNNSKQNWKDFK